MKIFLYFKLEMNIPEPVEKNIFILIFFHSSSFALH